MIPPTRWRDDPSVPYSVREALRAGSRSRPLPDESRQRSVSRVRRLVFLPAAAGLVFWIKSAAIASLCAMGTVAVVRLTAESSPREAAREPLATHAARAPMPGHWIASAPAAREPTAPPDVALSPTPAAATETASKELTPPHHAQTGGFRAPVGASHGASLDPAPGDALAREAAMLEEARAMLDGNASGTLAALDRYAARFPNGQLALEGELLAVDALRRLGRGGEAKARGMVLLGLARGTLYEQRIRSLIGP
jgi:hypothetical protein